jgi:tetratricopeptide (TPR) repeat protein
VSATPSLARSSRARSRIRPWIVSGGLVAILTSLPVALPAGFRLGAPTAEAAHPFYERRLTEGTLALEQERPQEAARLLEIAAFGLLDEPPRLSEALVRLALAQAEIGKPAAFRETLRRVAEIEERFGAYREADLTVAERTAFDQRITELTPSSELDRSPALQRLLQVPAGPEEPSGEPTSALTDSSQTESAPSESAPSENAPTENAKTENASAPASPVQQVPVELTPEEQQRVTRAREILSRARRARELDEALTLARPVADGHPVRRDLQQLVGEIAYRSSRWEEAVRYLESGVAPVLGSAGSPRASRPERPELLFYLAVALFESGRPKEAVEPLELALPQLERTPFVESYAEKILRTPSDPDATAPDNAP